MKSESDKVRYCFEMDRALYEAVRSVAQAKEYPMAAIFRDGVKLILEREQRGGQPRGAAQS